MLLLALACSKDDAGDNAATVTTPIVEEVEQVVPSGGLPNEVTPQDANNNLDIERHDDRMFMAFRTAPSHFASPDTVMYVVSTTDEVTWRYEGEFALDTDVREPQLVSWNGELYFYFAVLGESAIAFEPQGMVYTRYNGPGDWDDLTWFDDPTFIPWRIKPIDGVLHMIGYSGGGEIYEFGEGGEIEIRWLSSTDGLSWSPFVKGQEVVLSGGGSETDFVFLDNGDLVAVVRNEAGEGADFGSKICRAPADDLGNWDCKHDPRKYDSPLLFRHGDGIWLIGRRNVTDTGHYDLDMDDRDHADQYLFYQADYWGKPKRCGLWKVDPDALEVTHELDLPSRGDTCFPEMIPNDDDSVLVYNYSSPIDGPDVSWLDGQNGLTNIYRQIIRFVGVSPAAD